MKKTAKKAVKRQPVNVEPVVVEVPQKTAADLFKAQMGAAAAAANASIKAGGGKAAATPGSRQAIENYLFQMPPDVEALEPVIPGKPIMGCSPDGLICRAAWYTDKGDVKAWKYFTAPGMTRSLGSSVTSARRMLEGLPTEGYVKDFEGEELERWNAVLERARGLAKQFLATDAVRVVIGEAAFLEQRGVPKPNAVKA